MVGSLLYGDEGLLDRAGLVPPPEDPRSRGVAPWSGLPALPNEENAWVSNPLRATTPGDLLRQMRETLYRPDRPMYEEDRTARMMIDGTLGPGGAWGGMIGGVRGAASGGLAAAGARQSLPLARAAHAADPSRVGLVSTEDIWRQYGWQLFPDGQWRFEVPDAGSRLTPAAQAGQHMDRVPLRDVLQHDDAYNVYPGLGHMEASINVPRASDPILAAEPTMGGYFVPTGTSGRGRIVLAPTSSPDELHSILLHEGQHAIQNIEGHTPGTGPTLSSTQQRMGALDATVRAEQTRLLNMRNEFFAQRRSQPGGANISTSKLFDEWEVAHPAEAQTLDAVQQLIRNPLHNPHNVYQSALGEAEARAVQDRWRAPASGPFSPLQTMTAGASRATLGPRSFWNPNRPLDRIRRPGGLLEP